MLFYEYKVRYEFARTRDLAERIRDKFAENPDSSDLFKDVELLKTAHDQLKKILPKEVKNGNFGRHIYWLQYYLARNKPASCKGDIEDICKTDLPELEKSFREWYEDQFFFDKQFAAKVSGLLTERNFDSAVRTAFVLLTERLRKKFNLSSTLDGSRLVNEVFGKDKILAGKISEPERESMRNLLDGLFGVFRNKYSHATVESEWYEAEAVLSMINWVLKRINKYAAVITSKES